MSTAQQYDLLDMLADRPMSVYDRETVRAARPRLQPMVDTPRARAADPETSHQAAEAVRPVLRERQKVVLEAVRRWPGLTACELAELIDQHLDRGGNGYHHWRLEVSRRAAELRGVWLQNGPSRTCKVAGSKQMTWCLK